LPQLIEAAGGALADFPSVGFQLAVFGLASILRNGGGAVMNLFHLIRRSGFGDEAASIVVKGSCADARSCSAKMQARCRLCGPVRVAVSTTVRGRHAPLRRCIFRRSLGHAKRSGYRGKAESLEMIATLVELKEAMSWVKEPQNIFRFDVRIPNGIAHWSIVIDLPEWRVTCDEGEQTFTTENAACGYFWDRLREPPSKDTTG
jgi:hypothetical protein